MPKDCCKGECRDDEKKLWIIPLACNLGIIISLWYFKFSSQQMKFNVHKIENRLSENKNKSSANKI